MSVKIALISEDSDLIATFKTYLENEEHTILTYCSAAEALIKMKVSLPQIVFAERSLKVVDGIMFLKKVKEDNPEIPVVIMADQPSPETILEVFRAGASDFLRKPIDPSALLNLTKNLCDKINPDGAGTGRKAGNASLSHPIIGTSSHIKGLMDTIKQVSGTSANVLITGESGTGKELVAEALHYSGRRSDKPFIAINCSAIPENLLESELFGYVKGAFTGANIDKRGLFEEANGGTLFLDEIGDLSVALQVKLLRVLQEKRIRPVGGNVSRPVDVRIISATHRDLKAMSKEGSFREDLYYRINVIPIKVVPLRDRPDDIPVLAQHFIKKFCRENKIALKTVSEETMQVLKTHHWPGNVRELENQIERAMVLTSGNVLEKQCIVEILKEAAEPGLEKISFDRPTLKKLERRYIQIIIEEAKYGKEEVAKILGISRRTLYRKERQYGLVFDKKEKVY